MEIREHKQLEKAELEDALVELLYYKYKDLVFHGGTAIWRCYGGNRFSRDIDFYLNAKNTNEKMQYYKELQKFLKESGFTIKEKGYESATDTMHILVESGEKVKMKVDINFKYKKGKIADYRKIDDTTIVVLTLDPEVLLNEKIDAYNSKLDGTRDFSRPEIQDLYDIYHLVSIIKKRDKITVERLKALLNRIGKTQPSNASGLAYLIIAGLPPTFELMISKIREWIDVNG